MQLLLNDLNETPLVKAAEKTLTSILDQCEDREVQKKLKGLQAAANLGEGKLPIKPVATRCLLAFWE
jgi:hypothetical protein